MQLSDLFEDKTRYIIEIPDVGRILFRTLSCEEYFKYSKILRTHPNFKWDAEDEIWTKCVLQHTCSNSKDNLKAGVVTTIARLCLYYSYPSDINSANILLQEKRNSINTVREQAILTICKAFPTYLPEDLEKMDWDTITKRLAQSEFLLENEFAFKGQTSQPQDDSGKIFKNLEEYVETAIDFNQINKDFYKEEYGNPKGDYNLKNLRGM